MVHELPRKVVKVFDFNSLNGTDGWGDQDLNATGDIGVLTAVQPIDIYRFGYVTTAAQDPDAGGFVLSLDHRPTAGSDSGRTEKDVLTRADAQTVAAGKVVFRDVIIPVAQATGVDGSKVNVGPNGPLHLKPGEQAVLELTNANGAAATGFAFIEYVELSFPQPCTAANTDCVNLVKDTTNQ